jgi:hypothetical protein
MPTPISRHFSWLLVLLFTVAGLAQDLEIKKSVTVAGNVISSTDSAIQGARERTVTQIPGGSTVTIRQCDLKRTVHINEQSQTYFIASDPQDDAALKAAALVTGSPAAESGGTITESTAITDTGEHKIINGYPARHLTMRVAVQPSKNACSQQSQEFEVDGWYTDLSKEFASCQQSLPPVRQTEGCSDRVIHKVTGSGKLGYPLAQTITLHNSDGSTMQVGVQVSEISKQALAKELFDVPAGYREVKSLAELNAPPVIQTPQPAYAANPQAAVAGQNGMKGVNPAAMMFNPGAQMAMTQNAAMSQQMMAARTSPGAAFMGGGMQPQGGAMFAAPQQLGPKTPGKIRIGVAPPEAQLGQGTNAGVDYSTPIRNVEVALMNGPAIEIAALEAHVPLQLQAEAQQKQCDYILHSSVNVKHSTSGSFGKLMKLGSTAASFTPVGMMAKGMGTVVAAQAAGAAASQMAAQQAQQQALSQLAGFNGQIKSKDDVTVEYELIAAGQTTPVLQNTLKGKAKSDGEDVLTPLLQQTANSVVTQVSPK